jgi:Zn-dependent peptidase ImmA (M78 family)
MVRGLLEDDEEAEPLSFVGSMRRQDGVAEVAAAISRALRVDLTQLRSAGSPESLFGLLRTQAEALGVYVLLIGNLGSHHTAFDLTSFRGFALADPLAPFVVINDQDSKAAWSFTLLHELANLWIGATGVSGSKIGSPVEQFCNDVAAEILLPARDLEAMEIVPEADVLTTFGAISRFAQARHLSGSMVAYRLFRSNRITEETWQEVSAIFRQHWLRARAQQREDSREQEGGPTYYVVRRHRLGGALIGLVRRSLSDGSLSASKAGKVLGVRPTNVMTLVSG